MTAALNGVYRADCLAFMRQLPADSVNMVITSPPYWGLRSYGEEAKVAWGDWEGQLGLEPHPQMYIDHLVEICREIRRVLTQDGSFYLNLGDTYYASGGAGGDYLPGGLREGQPRYKQSSSDRSNWLQPKQKLLIPSRVAVALQEDGWVLRDEIVWHKENHMPSSQKDRLTCSWEAVYRFIRPDAKSDWFTLGNRPNPNPQRKPNESSGEYEARRRRAEERHRLWVESGVKEWWGSGVKHRSEIPAEYLCWSQRLDCYFNLDAIREPHQGRPSGNLERKFKLLPAHGQVGSSIPWTPGEQGKTPDDVLKSWGAPGGVYEGQATKDYESAKAQNPRDVKRRIVQSFLEHPERGKTPSDVVNLRTLESKIQDRPLRPPHHAYRGEGWEGINPNMQNHPEGKNPGDVAEPGDFWQIPTKPFKRAHFAVFPPHLCVNPILSSCPPDGLVFDPFCGSGTALAVAKALGRRWLGCDIHPGYVRMAEGRLGRVAAPLAPVARLGDALAAVGRI